MGKHYEEIPANLIDFIKQQELFWVGSAPLSGDGHVNISPKGLHGTFHVESPTEVWYEDMTGSGTETLAHLRENGRITIMFSAFQGPPRIVRLFGRGKVHQFGTPEYDKYLPNETRTAGSRAVIVVEVHRVGTSCGFAVPYYTFEKHRTQLTRLSASLESRDQEYELENPSEDRVASHAAKGMRMFWKMFSHSIDGLPSFDVNISAPKPLGGHQPPPAQPSSSLSISRGPKPNLALNDNKNLVVGIIIGIVITVATTQLTQYFAGHVATMVLR